VKVQVPSSLQLNRSFGHGWQGLQDVEWFGIKRTKEEFSLFKDESVELKVRADTLRAFVSSVRAVLYQKEKAPFTLRDMGLRETLFKWYPKKRLSPMPLLFGTEPEFEIAEQ
jgi:hypothetical protein